MKQIKNSSELQQLLLAVEEKMQWGEVHTWATKDFQRLSDAIQEHTGILLSISTLKRLFGKVNYQSNPSINTLDAIACFIGKNHWRDFQNSLPAQRKEKTVQESNSHLSIAYNNFTLPKQLLYKRITLFVFIGLLLVSLLALIPFNQNSSNTKAPLSTGKSHFSIKKVTNGLPNSVIFSYDVSKILGKSFQIQQYWDPKKRIDIDPKKQTASCFYQYPGYFRAKLVVDDKTIQEKHLFIPSNGWLAAIERNSGARYLLPEELKLNELMKISDNVFEEIREDKVINWLSFFYLEDFNHLQGEDFELKTSIRNTFIRGDNFCQASKINIIGTEGVISLPFVSKGCVGNIRLYLNGTNISAKDHDLSAFGYDFAQMLQLIIQKNNSSLRIYSQEELVYELDSIPDMGKIAGVKFSFKGAGEIDYVHLNVGKSVLISDHFGN